MKDLTKAEEQVMQILWKLKSAFVKDLIAEMPEPKPAYNTVSTIIRILEKKGFVDHRALGKTHEYFPKVSKGAYRKFMVKNLMTNYFGGSPQKVLSFLVEEEKLSVNDIDELMKMINDE